MSYFKDTKNCLHWLDDDSFANLLPIGSVKITQAAADSIMRPSISEEKIAKNIDIESWRDEARFTDITVTINGNPQLWQADKVSQDLISATINLASNGAATVPPEWRTEDNVNIPITLDDLKIIAKAISDRTSSSYAHSWDLKAQVDAATPKAQLNAILW